MSVPAGSVVVLFDGECHLCSGVVDFLLRRDAGGRLLFGSLQGEAGTRLRAEHRVPDGVDSIVVIEGGQVSLRSTAALRLCAHLRFPWPLLGALRAIPRPLRDAVYDLVARRRLRWFGRRDSCRRPTAAERGRFLDPPA